MLINVTTLTAYHYCSRKLFLDKVLGIKEPPSKHLVLGAIMHDFVEAASNAEEELVKEITITWDSAKVSAAFRRKHSLILKSIIIKRQYELKHYNLDLAETFLEMWKRVEPLLLERIQLVQAT